MFNNQALNYEKKISKGKIKINNEILQSGKEIILIANFYIKFTINIYNFILK